MKQVKDMVKKDQQFLQTVPGKVTKKINISLTQKRSQYFEIFYKLENRLSRTLKVTTLNHQEFHRVHEGSTLTKGIKLVWVG